MIEKSIIKAFEYGMTLFLILTFNFLIPRMMPGDPFTFLSSGEGETNITYSQQEIEQYKAYYGLDQPLFKQYVDYLTHLLRGNIGYSIYYHDQVLDIIGTRVLWTLSIVMAAILISFLIGTLLGSLSAWYRDRRLDQILYAAMIPLSEIPPFLIGVFFLFILAAQLGWFPISGGMTTFAVYGSPVERWADLVHHAILPVFTLSFVRLGEFYLLSRNGMITVLSKDYMRTARAKGLPKVRLLFRHALKNAFPPILTRVFLSLGGLFGGAILVENIFQYPGIGILMREAVMVRDYALIQGIFLLIAITVLSMNFVADFLYRKLDPRLSE